VLAKPSSGFVLREVDCGVGSFLNKLKRANKETTLPQRRPVTLPKKVEGCIKRDFGMGLNYLCYRRALD
jgi:hypothetical protein